MYALNQADKFILTIVIVDGDRYDGSNYIRNPFNTAPNVGVISVDYDLNDLLSQAVTADKA
ncbi:MAG: hypothetical protein CMH98_06165 [Oceanospirillaceae bacterium]|nr:hypothetical protein [Oceanospirillaceae bacterium]